MARLIYSMLMSLDGYTEDEHGDFGWGAPDDADVHRNPRQEATVFRPSEEWRACRTPSTAG